MKGFPNQIAELPKIATGMQCLVDIESAGENGKDDGVFGEALVRARVAGTGHTPKPIDEYLQQQRLKPIGGQSFRTTARGLRELYRLMGLIDDSGPGIVTTSLGKVAASFAGKPWDQSQIDFWRRVISNLVHSDDGGTSHPYQVMLRLVARKPGITRAKCALALEARDDLHEELERIAGLAELSEAHLIREIGVSKSNWDNAKKVLPKFAEQLGDVIRAGQSYVLADAPGRADAGPLDEPSNSAGALTQFPDATPRRREAAVPRAPKTSREVTPETIAIAGVAERSDDVTLPSPTDPTAMAAAIKARSERLKRHNLLVRELAVLFKKIGARLYEEPFDTLALFKGIGVLVEVKTLDGTAPDERDRIRDALGQLLYYEGFLPGAVAGDVPICKVACFESKVSDAHRAWLNQHGIATIWKKGNAFVGDDLAREFLRDHLEEFK